MKTSSKSSGNGSGDGGGGSDKPPTVERIASQPTSVRRETGSPLEPNSSCRNGTTQRPSLIEREWSSMSNIWQGSDNGNGVSGHINEDMMGSSPFLAASEETPFGRNSNFLNASVSTIGTSPDELFGGASRVSWNVAGAGEALHSSIGNIDYRGSSIESTTLCSQSSITLTDRAENGVYAGGVSSCIHDAARITDWSRVLSLCGTAPDAAKYKGRDGWTALHHACNRRCPHANVAEALIKAYPDALLDEEEKGWTPLHYACRFKAPKDVVRLLLRLYPEKGFATVSKQDKLGRTPLYYAVRYDAPPGVVGLLLEVDPSAVLEEDQNADSPLCLVWDSWADKLEGKRTLHLFLQPVEDALEILPLDASSLSTLVSNKEKMSLALNKCPKLLKRWNRVNMFLKAAFHFSVDGDEVDCKTMDGFDEKKDSIQDRTWRILHATVAIKCHPALFRIARTLYPEQVEELDENDLRDSFGSTEMGSTHQTALHLAAASNTVGEAGCYIIGSLLKMNRAAAQIPDGIDGSLPLHRIVENRHKRDWTVDGARDIYLAYTSATKTPDKTGKLPLHRAVSAINQTESEADAPTRSIIRSLITVYPQAASCTDSDGCLPLHKIVENAHVWDDDVEAVFNAHPLAVRVRCGLQLQNRLPIHLAASNVKANVSLVEPLVRANPQGATQADRLGKFPLHLACECGKKWKEDGLQVMYEAFPDAIRIPEGNRRAWTVLHMAAASESSGDDLLSKILQLFPESSAMVDSRGRYPIHLAAISGKSWLGGLKTLFESNADAVSIGDNDGLLPFHLAAFRFASDASPTQGDVDKQMAAKQLDILYHLLRIDPTHIVTV